MSKFAKTDKIKTNGKVWECIVSDDQVAVFGEITKALPFEKEKTVSYENTFAIDQNVQNGFEFKECVGICEHSGAYVFEDDKYTYDPEQNNYFLVV